MATMSAGNRLYLYQLFSQTIGIGKQARLDAYEAALQEDGLDVEDVGFETIGQLMEALDEFCKLTVFKGGRVFATIYANAEFDQALAKAADAAGAKQSSGKSFKRRKGVKTARPVKPRHRAQPALQASEPKDEAPVSSEARADLDAGSAEPAPTQSSSPADEATDELAHAKQMDDQDDQGQKDERSQRGDQPLEDKRDQDTDQALDQPGPAHQPADQTVEQAPEGSTQPASEAQAPLTNEPTSPVTDQEEHIEQRGHITLNITYNPYEGLDEEIEKAAAAADQAAEPPVDASADQAPDAPAAPAAASQVKAGTIPTVQEKPQPVPRPQANTPASCPQAGTPAPVVALTPERDRAGRPLVALRDQHPRRFSSEVRISNELLQKLYDALPYTTEPLRELDRSWRRARATGLLYGSDGRISFALGYLRTDKKGPATATIKHTKKTSSGKQWDLVELDLGPSSSQDPARSLLPLGADTKLVDNLASLLCLGSWDQAARLVRHYLPQVSPSQIRSYLPAVVSAVVEQDALVTTPDKTQAAFLLTAPPRKQEAQRPQEDPAIEDATASYRDTGGLVPHAPSETRALYALLDRREGDDIAWTLAGCAPTGDARLAVFEALPKPPVLDPTLQLC